MKPASPVAYDSETRWGISEIVYANDLPQYLPLPALRWPDGLVVSRWHPSWKERLLLILGGDVYLGLLTFNNPLQPIMLSTDIQEVIK